MLNELLKDEEAVNNSAGCFATYAFMVDTPDFFEYLTKSAFALSFPSGSLHALKRSMTLTNTEFYGEWRTHN